MGRGSVKNVTVLREFVMMKGISVLHVLTRPALFTIAEEVFSLYLADTDGAIHPSFRFLLALH